METKYYLREILQFLQHQYQHAHYVGIEVALKIYRNKEIEESEKIDLIKKELQDWGLINCEEINKRKESNENNIS